MDKKLRDITVDLDFIDRKYRSLLISVGNTKVICYATLVRSVPKFLKSSQQGWLSAEYSMLPGSSDERIPRESVKGKQKGRTLEIQRLISRSLRQALDLSRLKDMTIIIDCDVIQADGGTRTASITGGYIALELAIREALKLGELKENPIVDQVAGISLGLVNGEVVLDMNFEQDFAADVDINMVMNSKNRLIELQSTAEGRSFSIEELNSMLELGSNGLKEIFELQRKILGG